MASSDELLAAFGERGNCALATIKADGRPQLTNIAYVFDPASATFQISITEDRVKTKNLRRDPRATLYTTSADGWAYTVADGIAQLSPVAREPEDATVDALVELYRGVSGGEHPDWADYRRAMVADRRLLLTVRVEHAYGAPPR